MNKEELLLKISKQGDRFGRNGGVLSLLEYTGRLNTQEVQKEDCEEFLRVFHCSKKKGKTYGKD